MLLIFDMHVVNAALFLKVSFLFILLALLVLTVLTLILPFTTIHSLLVDRILTT